MRLVVSISSLFLFFFGLCFSLLLLVFHNDGQGITFAFLVVCCLSVFCVFDQVLNLLVIMGWSNNGLWVFSKERRGLCLSTRHTKEAAALGLFSIVCTLER